MHQPALFLSEAADSDVIWCTSRLIWHRRKQKTITVKLWTKCEPTRSATSKLITKKTKKNLLLRCFLGHSVIFGLGQPWLTSRSWWQGGHKDYYPKDLSYIYCALYLSLWWVFNGGQPLLKELEKKNGNKKKKIDIRHYCPVSAPTCCSCGGCDAIFEKLLNNN